MGATPRASTGIRVRCLMLVRRVRSETGPPDAAAHIFRTVWAAVCQQASPQRTVEVEYRSFASAKSSIRLNGGLLRVQISDVLENAPEAVLVALAHILIAKLYRTAVPSNQLRHYRQYLRNPHVARKLQSIRKMRGRKLMGPAAGRYYDLAKIFDELNVRYFFGLMAQPDLGWSLRSSRSTLGHYDPSLNTIVISKLLDHSAIPQLAVDYVMFHEMLHLRYPVEYREARRCIHTAEFKQAERQFEGYQKARDLLKALPRG